MKINKIFFLPALILFLASCEKDEPIADLGRATENYRPELRVSTSNRTPAAGETVNITATTWHRNDRIAKVEFLHKLYEDFGVYLELQTTKIDTWDPDEPIMVVTDTIAKDEIWKSVPEGGKPLNDYFVTASNAYTIVAPYDKFKLHTGMYSAEGEALLNQLPAEAYKILLNQLSHNITVQEYTNFFPAAPNDHYTMTGAAKTGISDLGKMHLQNNLTKQLLKDKGFKTLRKEGVLRADVTTRSVAESGAITQVKNQFVSPY